MTSLSIKENEKIGSKIYYLNAVDIENEPIHYFIRNMETNENDTILFNITSVVQQDGYVGIVTLNQNLDYEKRNSYNYLVYAYDGVNLIERMVHIIIIDVDDEKPEILKNKYFNKEMQRFEFEIAENASVGFFLNEFNEHNFKFIDVDTPIDQLKVKLVDASTGLSTIPFILNNFGNLMLINPIDYESQSEYLLEIIVQVKLLKY
jgi:hypothetical protein